MIRSSVLALSICLPLFAGAPLPSVESVTTNRVDFSVNGTIRIENSTGELNIEGWDQPAIEVTVTRYAWNKNENRVKGDLDRVPAAKPVVSGSEATISVPRDKLSGVRFDYRIRVPRGANLIIRHRSGDVVIEKVAGDIDAAATSGMILLQVPAAGQYSVDAKSKSGGDVYSEVTGDSHHNMLFGERLAASAPAPAHHLRLRIGFGGIVIQKIAG
ncbi:MAG TPA: DUF4097 family beta strand repeat-containing protein [Bryobacteraceae bacterium]|nr:DUF4097 family beta strand repeat-containing protein [Bryobacteraceae bacterium]